MYDNNQSNVSAYQKLFAQNTELKSQFFITMEVSGKTYLYYDTVHLIKNVCKNLLGSKRFIFLPFTFQILSMGINAHGGQFPGSCSMTCVKKMNTEFSV